MSLNFKFKSKILLNKKYNSPKRSVNLQKEKGDETKGLDRLVALYLPRAVLYGGKVGEYIADIVITELGYGEEQIKAIGGM